MAWHVIETLAPGAATVSFSDGKAVEWGSVGRLGAKLGVHRLVHHAEVLALSGAHTGHAYGRGLLKTSPETDEQ